jgi:NADH:ubiquinone oxidoreductase subunit F (NADH-binding)
MRRFPDRYKVGPDAINVSDVKYVICNGDEGDPGALWIAVNGR